MFSPNSYKTSFALLNHILLQEGAVQSVGTTKPIVVKRLIVQRITDGATSITFTVFTYVPFNMLICHMLKNFHQYFNCLTKNFTILLLMLGVIVLLQNDFLLESCATKITLKEKCIFLILSITHSLVLSAELC